MRLVIESVNDAIAEVYEQRGVQGVPPRYSMVLIRLGALGSLTIRGLATEVEVTHSAMSQTVAAMRRDGLVETVPGADARTREVALTDLGRDLVPFLEAEWWATEAAIAELEAEVECTLTEAAVQIQAVLQRRPFTDRLSAHLGAPDAQGRVPPDPHGRTVSGVGGRLRPDPEGRATSGDGSREQPDRDDGPAPTCERVDGPGR